jgi:hypothetical protein
MLFLCSFAFGLQISDGCAPSWLTHLKGGLQMTDQVSSASGEAEAMKRFFNMYFVAHDIMGRTAFEDKWEGPPRVSWLESDNMEEVRMSPHMKKPSCADRLIMIPLPQQIDATMGCSRGLMTLVSEISSLAHERARVCLPFP